MKIISLIVIAAGLIGLVLMAGCQESLMQKLDRAKQSAQDERQGIQKTEPNAQSDYSDEWQAFRTEAEAQIAANAKRLDELKLGMSKSDDQVRATVEAQIQALMKRNDGLKEQLDGYRDQGRLNWNAFKRDFSQDLDGLSKAVKDVTTDKK